MHREACVLVNEDCKQPSIEKASSTGTAFEAQKERTTFFPKHDEGSLLRAEQGSQDLLQAALEYAAKGIPVFPCKPDEPNVKRPLVKNGFKDATTDVAKIRTWWGQWPNAMIGMPTGKFSGLWVLDIDTAKKTGEADGFSSLQGLGAVYGSVPAATRQRTPSGGQHIFFKYTAPIRNSAGKIGTRIDVRGDGGYVIMAPSTILGVGSYIACPNFLHDVPEAPEWLLALALSDKKESHRKKSLSQDGGSPYGRKALEEECEKLALTPNGQQNETLNTCAFRLGQLIGGGHLKYENAYGTYYPLFNSGNALIGRKVPAR